jgi:hypothetical protein
MPTLESVTSSRITLTFMAFSSTYQALPADSGAISSSLTAFVSRKHENRPDLSSVGCTTRSTPP